MRLQSFRKFILILVSIWLLLVLLGLIFSRSMQDKVIDILSEQANKYLLSEVHIRKSNIRFSVFKRFPHASLELKDLTAKLPTGLNQDKCILIKGDTLLFAKKVYLQLNIISIITNNYKIEKIEVHDGFLQILSDKSGNSSINIIKKTGIEGKNKEITTQIDAIICSDLTLFTSDISNLSSTEVFVQQGNLSGIFEKNKFSVNIKSKGILNRFEGKGQILYPYQQFSVDTRVKKSKESYIVEKGLFRFGNIPFKVIGSIRTGKNTLIDLIFSAKKIPIKQIDKTLLHGLMGEKGFEPKGGTLNLQATFIGYTRYSIPAIKANFKLENGKLYDIAHDQILNEVFFIGNADNGQDHLPKSSTIRLDTFSFKTDKSHQWGKLKIQNLIQPRISLFIQGFVSVDDLQKVANLPNITLYEGLVVNKAALSGRIRKTKQDKTKLIQDLRVRGNFILQNIKLNWSKYNIPLTTLNGKVELVNKSTLKFDELKAKSAKSDISITGQLLNFNRLSGIPEFKGIVHSESFVVDNFLLPPKQNNSKKKQLTFPDSIKISARLLVDYFAFGNFKTQNYSSQVFYNNNKLTATGITMTGYEGNLNGKVTFTQKVNKNIDMWTDGRLNHVNIQKLFYACNNFSQDIIQADHIKGYLSGDIQFESEWSENLEFIPGSIIAQGNLNLKDGSLKNYDPLLALSDFIHVDELKDVRFNNLNTSLTIRNKQVFLDQTHIVSSAITFDGSGVHGFDNKYEYRLQLGLSDVLWGKAKRKRKEITEFGYIVDDGVGHTKLPLIISGKGTTFNVKYDKKTARKTFRTKIEDEKKELRDLFRKKEKDEQIQDEQFRIELEKEEKVLEPEKEKTDTDRSSSEEFILEWDDSEDE